MPHQASFTLFPYTTLFRSEGEPMQWSAPANLEQVQRGSLGLLRREVTTCPAPQFADFLLRWQGAQDRKSTRLNSSHVKISYAVFCLKKKKQVSFMTHHLAV